MHNGSHRPGDPGRTCGCVHSNFHGRSTFIGRVRGQPSNPTHTSKTTYFIAKRNPVNQDGIISSC